jgi:hypothetical protein
MIAANPWQGGATWAVLQYLLGFRQLGHDVYFLEPLLPSALLPAGSGLVESDNAQYFRKVMREFGLECHSALLLSGTKQTLGLNYERLEKVARQADLAINISGLLTDENLLGPVPVRAYLDLDPAFIQLWNAVEGIDMRFDGHTHFVTIGQSIGEPDCPVPTCGLNWLKTLPPVVLERWPIATQSPTNDLTTVGNWRGYGSIHYQGVQYGQKAHSLRQFFTLPTRTGEPMRMALAIHAGEAPDLSALATNGWHLVDPSDVARTPADYQKFIQESKAEFGIAKSGYVLSRCGWFSDRSACYLASGRPVIAQETGFSHYLPTGEGLFAFERDDEALGAIEELRKDYARHAAGARSLAEEYLDSRKVLPRFLEQIGV